ncbi:lanthionine synthetase LanC family protein [Parasulfitobacter algicola]|uniref:Protein kinase n=1 Tax=Parasulfitobacter algicola TaxID=2614809 RepID=A0ABX2IPR2_9RHOB|nr:lanthionine synthetase LanC family protein [Sulfitobacter algicola]NSX54350.1 protein kinase [Sulfitobacter algicola]
MSIETQAFVLSEKNRLKPNSAQTPFPWIQIGQTERQQGWKIHLSCGPDQLGFLVAKLKRLLRPTATPFKHAQDEDVVMLLNDGSFGLSQIGKCVTIYPVDEHEFEQLCLSLVKMGGFGGPSIRDDVHLGGAVYVRYGAFNPVTQNDDFGRAQSFIENEYGALVADSYSYDHALTRFQRTFGARMKHLLKPSKKIGAGTILNDRYMVLGTIRESTKGSIYQTIDMTEKTAYRPVILKEGKSGIMRDIHGRDIQSRLKHQFAMHKRVAEHGVAPKCDPYFEVGTSGFLPMECMLGDDFEKFVHHKLNQRRWDVVPLESRRSLLRMLQKIASAVSQLHDLGIIHRDLTPSNILLNSAGKVFLSDLEIACAVGCQTPLFENGTPGFMPLSQIVGAQPSVLDDVYAYAALCLFTITGLDPRRLTAGMINDLSHIRDLAKTVSDGFWHMIELGLSQSSSDRPSLEEFMDALDAEISFPHHVTAAPRASMEDAQNVLHQGVASLVSQSFKTSDGLWISKRLKPGDHSDVQRSLHSGVAGVLYFLADYAKSCPIEATLKQQCQTNANWLIQGYAVQTRTGLHFGETGVLLALNKAHQAGIITIDDNVMNYMFDHIVEQKTVRLDVTHGIAGIALAFAGIGTPKALRQAQVYLDQLCKLQNPDGSFAILDRMDGFAHGNAGIGYALAKLGAFFCNADYTRCAEAVADYLMSDLHQSALSDQGVSTWCNGVMGTSYLFSELYQATGKYKYLNMTLKCFADATPDLNPTELGVCNGLAGNGVMLMDAHCTTHEAQLNDTAAAYVATVLQRMRKDHQDVYWVTDDAHVVSTDLMGGFGGVLQFLLRFVTRDASVGIPGCTPLISYRN